MLRLDLRHIAALCYIGPALLALVLAPQYGHSFSSTGTSVILASVAATVAGLVAASILLRRTPSAPHVPPSSDQLTRVIAYVLMAIGIVAIIFSFITVQSVPLFQKGQGRVAMSTSILWNIYIFCGTGIFMYAVSIRRSGISTLQGNAMVVLYVLLAIATAWKGTALYFAVLLAVPLLKGRRLRVEYIALAAAALTALFFGVNWMRATNNSFGDLINQPVYYAIWGFVNFDVEAVGHTSNCLHSIPGFGCRFEVPNFTLVMPAFNTYSALAPLYIDGGYIMVIITFFIMAFALGIAARTASTLLTDYFCFLGVYFFFMAHNGYMFYSKTYVATLVFLLAASFMFTKFPQVAPNFRRRFLTKETQ